MQVALPFPETARRLKHRSRSEEWPSMFFQHDFDEELGCYWYGDPPPKFPNTVKAADVNVPIKAGCKQGNPRPPVESTSANFRRRRDEAYWNEAGDLLFEYFELKAGALYSETLVDGF